MRLESFMLGVIATALFTAGVFFLKYWRRSRDVLFLAFGFAFILVAFNRASLLFMAHPSEAATWYYLIRLLAFLIILAAILKKNYERQ
ncbi:MAG: DUF5985 family protein [Terracidiphilus sp.]